jgi:glutathione S-transferase
VESNAIGIFEKGGSAFLPRRSRIRQPREEDDDRTRRIRPYAFAPDSRDPFGRVPAFRDGEFTLYETSAVVRHIRQSFRGPSLLARNARPRATMEPGVSAHGAPDRALIDAAVW